MPPAGAPAGNPQWELDNDFSVSEDTPDWTWRVNAAFENYFNTKKELTFREAYKKQELKTRLDFKYGSGCRYVQSITDVRFSPVLINSDIGDDFPYAANSRIWRNLRISGESGEVIVRELYYCFLQGSYRLRIGNQVYPWGTADGLNPTSWLNPRDLRELFLIPEEEFLLGVPSVSGMFFFSDFTLSLVFVPVHTAAALPSSNHFWAVKEAADKYPVYFDAPDPMAASSENFAYAARAASTVGGIDFSVSGYHGPDNDMLMVPWRIITVPGQPTGLLIRPRSFLVNYVGADFSFSRGDWVINAEAAYCPNKSGLVAQDTDRPWNLRFPYDIRETDYLAYSLGFNYYIPLYRLLPGHAGEALFTAEWYQASSFDKAVIDPLISELLSFELRDSYFDKRVDVRLTAIFETRGGGVIFWPRLGYDFGNGFAAELGWLGVNGRGKGDYERNSFFYHYRENDLITAKITFSF